MRNQDYQFETEITLLGDDKPATCHYTRTAVGHIVPYLVKVGNISYPVDNWRQQLRREAEADYQARHGAAV